MGCPTSGRESSRTDGDADHASGHHCGGSLDSFAPVGADDVVFPTAMGGIALVLMLISEFGFVLWIRGLSIKEYCATRDPVSGAAYCLPLIVFAIMPVFISRA